jgi:hypothetical protein
MSAPKAPIPPGLGRQLEGLPDDVPYYGQVLGTSVLPHASWHPRQTNGWFPAMAGEWNPMTYSRRWDPSVPEPGSSRSRVELDDGRAELELMFEVYKALLNATGKLSYAKDGKHGRTYLVEEYLRDRDAYFGSTQAYMDYRDIAFEELEADNASLRGRLEPNKRARPRLKRWKEAQVCFYAWTRKAFEKKLGRSDKIVGIIRLGSSKVLTAAVTQVKADYGGSFSKEEANARPIKKQSAYRLGTLSDHALGDAVDIDPAKNAQITADQWKAIEAYTGKTLSKATREARWATNPQALHAAIVEINDEFIRLLELEIDKQVAAGIDNRNETLVPALRKANKHLDALGTKFLEKWKHGFFGMPWALLKELHEEKLRWGAVFTTLDLHHFEVP